VAVIGPPRKRLVTAERVRELLRSAPPVDGELPGELQEIRLAAELPDEQWQF
jgi:hypothetical protein